MHFSDSQVNQKNLTHLMDIKKDIALYEFFIVWKDATDTSLKARQHYNSQLTTKYDVCVLFTFYFFHICFERKRHLSFTAIFNFITYDNNPIHEWTVLFPFYWTEYGTSSDFFMEVTPVRQLNEHKICEKISTTNFHLVVYQGNLQTSWTSFLHYSAAYNCNQISH